MRGHHDRRPDHLPRAPAGHRRLFADVHGPPRGSRPPPPTYQASHAPSAGADANYDANYDPSFDSSDASFDAHVNTSVFASIGSCAPAGTYACRDASSAADASHGVRPCCPDPNDYARVPASTGDGVNACVAANGSASAGHAGDHATASVYARLGARHDVRPDARATAREPAAR